MATKMCRKLLLAFDFDNTIVDKNCDTFIYQLAPNGKIPDHLKSLYHKTGWTNYMNHVFKYLHQNSVSVDKITECVKTIPLTHGIKDLLQLPREQVEVIIISDANSMFIEEILRKHELWEFVKASFTNPARVESDGCLQIEMYHRQDSCTLSQVNLCKGSILSNYVESRMKEGVIFPNIGYIGDGYNDFCPSLRLRSCDFAFPRIGYTLLKTINEYEKENDCKLGAKVYPWESGAEILSVVSPLLSNLDSSSNVPCPRLLNLDVSKLGRK